MLERGPPGCVPSRCVRLRIRLPSCGLSGRIPSFLHFAFCLLVLGLEKSLFWGKPYFTVLFGDAEDLAIENTLECTEVGGLALRDGLHPDLSTFL